MTAIAYLLDRANVSPGPGFVRLPIGERQGIHTGGPWYHPDKPNEIWKPLDCLPYYNAPLRVTTQEAQVLAAARDLQLPAFPFNWQVILHPDRHWLVRRRMLTEGFEERHVAVLERGLRAFNQAGYRLWDYPIEAAIDPLTDQPFWLDLSAARKCDRVTEADDTHAWLHWLDFWGFKEITRLREIGRVLGGLERARGDVAVARRCRGYQYRYGTHCDDLIVRDCDAIYLDGLPDDPFKRWVLTKEPLPDYVADGTLLTWAWSPIHPKEIH